MVKLWDSSLRILEGEWNQVESPILQITNALGLKIGKRRKKERQTLK